MSDLPAFDPGEEIVRARLRPKDAATLILIRRDSDAPRVLMGRRHAAMAFQPNKFVFPGGRVDPGDLRLAVATDLRNEVAEKAAIGIGRARARGLALAAIRETFEETGILLGGKGAPPPTRAPAWRKFFAHGVVPRLEHLSYIARAITPPNRARRFDARFFMANATGIAHVLEKAETDELLEPCWLTFAEARALDLMSITRAVLAEAEARLDLAKAADPIPFFRFRNRKSDLTYL